MNTRAHVRWLHAAGLAAPLAAGGCLKVQHQVDPIKIEPIYATFDVNLKIDRQLDDFFAFEEQAVAPATAPATPPAASADPTPETGG